MQMSFLSTVIELILFNGSAVMVTFIAENVSIKIGRQRILYPVLKNTCNFIQTILCISVSDLHRVFIEGNHCMENWFHVTVRISTLVYNALHIHQNIVSQFLFIKSNTRRTESWKRVTQSYNIIADEWAKEKLHRIMIHTVSQARG